MKNFTTFAHTFALAIALSLPSSSLADNKSPDAAPAPAPEQAEAKPAADAAAKPDAKDAEKKEGEKEAAPAAPVATEPAELDFTAQNLTLKIRAQMEEIDKQFALIKEPTSMLSSMIESRKERIEQSIVRINETALELAALQEEFNQTNTGAYNFKCETDLDRYKYTQDGLAAYKSMMMDLKDRNFARKAMGINKFAAYQETFMGIEGYEDAFRFYALNVEGLHKKWMKAKESEEKKRERYADKKRELAEEADERDLDRLRKKAEAAGYNLDEDWYSPEPKNLAMLDEMTTRSTRAVREIEHQRKDKVQKGTGSVSPLIVTFWAKMDEVRNLMVSGDLEGAKDLLSSDPSFDNVLRLDRRLFPEEYCAPLREDYRDLEDAIRDRGRDKKRLEYKLESKTSQLEREVDNAQSQISAILEEIEKELALQNETDAEEAVQMSEADRIKASKEADQENVATDKEVKK